MVRAKFYCESKEHDSADPSHGAITLRAVFDGSEENKQFFRLTPCGLISISTLNPKAFDGFEVGKQYYVDFSSAETEATEAADIPPSES